ncbi:MAG: AI-2E family transporter [Phycisphaerae bacterium]|nr:AI-2E family transporter [Phycisphaerae bacterium]
MNDTPPTRPDWQSKHLWQFQPVRDLLVLAGVVGLFWLGYRLSIVTVPLLLALLLAYLFEPLVAKMTRSGKVGRARVALSIILLAGLLVGVPAVLGVGWSLVQGVKVVQNVASGVDLVSRSVRKPDDEVLAQRLQNRGRAWMTIRDFIVAERARAGAEPRSAPTPGNEPAPPSDIGEHPAGEYSDPMHDVLSAADEPSDLFRAFEIVRVWLTQNAGTISRNLVSAGGGALGAAVSLVGSIGAFVFSILLTAFFFFFFCTGYGKVLEFWQGLLPERKKGRALELAAKMDVVISGFVRGRLTICGILMVVYTVGYWLIGVPAPFVLGVVTGLLTLVPYAAGAVIPVAMLLMWLQPGEGLRSHWWWIVGSPFLVFMIAQPLDDYFLTPRIQGKTTNMDVPTILFASIAGGTLLGFYGLLLAIPVAACIKILLRELFWPRLRDWAKGSASDLLPISRE